MITRKGFKKQIDEALKKENIEGVEDISVYDSTNLLHGFPCLTIAVVLLNEPGMMPAAYDAKYGTLMAEVKEIVESICPIERACQVLVTTIAR